KRLTAAATKSSGLRDLPEVSNRVIKARNRTPRAMPVNERRNSRHEKTRSWNGCSGYSDDSGGCDAIAVPPQLVGRTSPDRRQHSTRYSVIWSESRETTLPAVRTHRALKKRWVKVAMKLISDSWRIGFYWLDASRGSGKTEHRVVLFPAPPGPPHPFPR